MCNIPSAFIELERKARKPHKCCECGKVISPRELYIESSGIWDGEPNRYRTCKKCTRLKQRAFMLGADDPDGCGLLFGGLFEALREALSGCGAHLREEIRKARQAH